MPKPAPSTYNRLLNSVATITATEPKAIEFSQRSANILSHYSREIDRGHMDIISATDRAIGDIAGCNYHPTREQRHKAVAVHNAEETPDVLP